MKRNVVFVKMQVFLFNIHVNVYDLKPLFWEIIWNILLLYRIFAEITISKLI